MSHNSNIHPHMDVIGADGVNLGKVAEVLHHRIVLAPSHAPGSHGEHRHTIPIGLVAEVEGHSVRLSATAANALQFEEESEG